MHRFVHIEDGAVAAQAMLMQARQENELVPWRGLIQHGLRRLAWGDAVLRSLERCGKRLAKQKGKQGRQKGVGGAAYGHLESEIYA